MNKILLQMAAVIAGLMVFPMTSTGQTQDKLSTANVAGTGLIKQISSSQSGPLLSEYRLSKYDVLNIVIIGFNSRYFNDTVVVGDSMSQTNQTTQNTGFNDVMIGPDGNVNLPYAGTVRLAGLTINEATQILTDKLGEYIKIPAMTIMVKKYGPRKVYVVGSVNKQGIYDLDPDHLNVFAALTSAGGIDKRGRTKKIAIIRNFNGNIQVREIDYKKFVEQHDSTQNPALQDGDMVYVPKSDKVIFEEDILPYINVWALYKSITQ